MEEVKEMLAGCQAMFPRPIFGSLQIKAGQSFSQVCKIEGEKCVKPCKIECKKCVKLIVKSAKVYLKTVVQKLQGGIIQ